MGEFGIMYEILAQKKAAREKKGKRKSKADITKKRINASTDREILISEKYLNYDKKIHDARVTRLRNEEHRKKVFEREYDSKRKIEQEKNKARMLENKKHISDSYVKLLLISGSILQAADIPKELIEAKRLQIKLTR